MIPATRNRHILPKWFGKQPHKSVVHFKCATGFSVPHSEYVLKFLVLQHSLIPTRQQNIMFASTLPKGMSSESLRESSPRFHAYLVATTNGHIAVKMFKFDDGVNLTIILLLSVNPGSFECVCNLLLCILTALHLECRYGVIPIVNFTQLGFNLRLRDTNRLVTSDSNRKVTSVHDQRIR